MILKKNYKYLRASNKNKRKRFFNNIFIINIFRLNQSNNNNKKKNEDIDFK